MLQQAPAAPETCTGTAKQDQQINKSAAKLWQEIFNWENPDSFSKPFFSMGKSFHIKKAPTWSYKAFCRSMPCMSTFVQMPMSNNSFERVANQQNSCWVKLFQMIVQLSSTFGCIESFSSKSTGSESMTFYSHRHLRLKRHAFSIKTWKYWLFREKDIFIKIGIIRKLLDLCILWSIEI